jgi:hypothetical protein
MELFKQLISSPFGIMSAMVILFMLAMGVFFTILFVKKAMQAPEPPQDSDHEI